MNVPVKSLHPAVPHSQFLCCFIQMQFSFCKILHLSLSDTIVSSNQQPKQDIQSLDLTPQHVMVTKDYHHSACETFLGSISRI